MSVVTHGLCGKCHRTSIILFGLCGQCRAKRMHLEKWQTFVRTVDAELASAKDRIKTP